MKLSDSWGGPVVITLILSETEAVYRQTWRNLKQDVRNSDCIVTASWLIIMCLGIYIMCVTRTEQRETAIISVSIRDHRKQVSSHSVASE